MQLYYPLHAGGPNTASLVEAQVNFIQFGACSRSMAKNVRKPDADDSRDRSWFPLWERRIDIPDLQNSQVHLQHMTAEDDLYYWLRT